MSDNENDQNKNVVSLTDYKEKNFITRNKIDHENVYEDEGEDGRNLMIELDDSIVLAVLQTIFPNGVPEGLHSPEFFYALFCGEKNVLDELEQAEEYEEFDEDFLIEEEVFEHIDNLNFELLDCYDQIKKLTDENKKLKTNIRSLKKKATTTVDKDTKK